MAEYIEREALMKFPIRRDHYDRKNGNEHFISGIESVLEFAENLPSADVAPVVHGRWIPNDGSWICSECNEENCYAYDGKSICFTDNYCPNCGARMDLVVMDNGQK